MHERDDTRGSLAWLRDVDDVSQSLELSDPDNRSVVLDAERQYTTRIAWSATFGAIGRDELAQSLRDEAEMLLDHIRARKAHCLIAHLDIEPAEA